METNLSSDIFFSPVRWRTRGHHVLSVSCSGTRRQDGRARAQVAFLKPLIMIDMRHNIRSNRDRLVSEPVIGSEPRPLVGSEPITARAVSSVLVLFEQEEGAGASAPPAHGLWTEDAGRRIMVRLRV